MFEREKITLAIGDRIRFTKNVMVRQKPHVVKVLAIERREGTRV